MVAEEARLKGGGGQTCSCSTVNPNCSQPIDDDDDDSHHEGIDKTVLANSPLNLQIRYIFIHV